MKLLVTGGCGFIGSHFIKHILKKYPNYQIINLDKLTYCANLGNLKEIENNPNYTFIKGDICDFELVNKLTKKVDYIINFAAESHVDNSIKNPKAFIETNINGVYNILEASKNNQIKKFLQISTDEVYGSIKNGFFTEQSPLKPNSPYSSSKANADLLCRAYFKTYNLPILITRCTNNFGENQFEEKLIPFFISKLLKNEKVTIYGNGLNIRDWLYVKDHVEAIDLVLHNGKIGEIYNIGANNEKTNLEITNFILKKLNKTKEDIIFIKDRLGHDERYALNCNKIKKELNWSAKYPFDEMLEKTIQWYADSFKDA